MKIAKYRRTEQSLVHLLCCESENGYQFSHDFNKHFGQCRVRFFDFGINHKPSNEAFDAFEYFDKGVVACFHRVGHLEILEIRTARGESVRRYAQIGGH